MLTVSVATRAASFVVAKRQVTWFAAHTTRCPLLLTSIDQDLLLISSQCVGEQGSALQSVHRQQVHPLHRVQRWVACHLACL